MDSELRAKENHANVQPVICFFLVVGADSVASNMLLPLNILCHPHFPAQSFYQPAALWLVPGSDKKHLTPMIYKTYDFRMVLEESGRHKKTLIHFALLSISYGLASL